MDALELVSVAERIKIGECPYCRSKLSYATAEISTGVLEKNGMANTCETVYERHTVMCKRCGYKSPAIQLGLRIIPKDRLIRTDIHWDEKYLEENTLVFGEKGKNPFYKKEKD